jgi:hypothetical protein
MKHVTEPKTGCHARDPLRVDNVNNRRPLLRNGTGVETLREVLAALAWHDRDEPLHVALLEDAIHGLGLHEKVHVDCGLVEEKVERGDEQQRDDGGDVEAGRGVGARDEDTGEKADASLHEHRPAAILGIRDYKRDRMEEQEDQEERRERNKVAEHDVARVRIAHRAGHASRLVDLRRIGKAPARSVAVHQDIGCVVVERVVVPLLVDSAATRAATTAFGSAVRQRVPGVGRGARSAEVKREGHENALELHGLDVGAGVAHRAHSGERLQERRERRQATGKCEQQ